MIITYEVSTNAYVGSTPCVNHIINSCVQFNIYIFDMEFGKRVTLKVT